MGQYKKPIILDISLRIVNDREAEARPPGSNKQEVDKPDAGAKLMEHRAVAGCWIRRYHPHNLGTILAKFICNPVLHINIFFLEPGFYLSTSTFHAYGVSSTY